MARELGEARKAADRDPLLPLRVVPPRFEARRLFEEDFVVAMRKGHHFARSPTLAAYSRSQHLLVSLSGDPHGFVDEFLAKRGLKRRVALTVPTFMMALAHLSSLILSRRCHAAS